ncbi:MAG: AAA family ATPase [Myxococcales bacterium]|nr:AAA family ATPase [Myxococcales bacterium]
MDAGTFKHFTLVELLHEGSTTVLYRARDRRDGASVILKHLEPERASPAAIARLRSEHELLTSLEDPGFVEAIELDERGGGHTLVLRDVGGETLERHLERARPGLLAALELGVQLAELLARLHAQRVIHKDINPRNVLVTPAGRVQLIDFGLATRLPRELASPRSPSALEGTLAYIAPEQTGRMNRPLDHRADLYSCGATLYHMITGRPPFTTTDPAELVHSHIALTPESPRRVAFVPAQLSEIVMRLLAKAADARYQSAHGLAVDLRECLRQLRERGVIEGFALGGEDHKSWFELPYTLYGREEALAEIEAALERVRACGCELLLIQGPAGVGKTALVHELQRDLARHRGLLAVGKYDVVQRDIPYSGLLRALSRVATYLLADTPEHLARWRARLAAAVGASSRVVTDALPDFASLFEETGALQALSPTAERSRMHETFRRFIHALARQGRPLVLFLDDLQWADRATLELLPILVDADARCSLLLLGSFRDDEVDAAHPLRAALAALAGAGKVVHSVTLGPLGELEISRLLQDALALGAEDVAPLATRVLAKTGGNAFFVGQFLTALHREGLLEFDAERGRWVWELAAIDAAPITDNVVEVLERRARAQGAATLSTLQLAACFGVRCELRTLARVEGRAEPAVRRALQPALEDGLINVVEGGAYQFLHDRVREAVYGTLEPEARTRLHLAIGRFLLKRLISDDARAELFDALSHVNRAEALIEDARERERVAWLNLSAGRKAQAAAAFDAAAEHYAVSRRLLPAHAWSRDHDRAWLLLRSAAACEFVLTRFEAARALWGELHRRARDELERAEIEIMRVALHVHRGEHEQAIARGRVAMSLLGAPLPRSPGLATVMKEYARARLAIGRRTPAELLQAPRTDDRRVQILRDALHSISGAAWSHDENLMLVLGMRAATLAARHGNTATSAASYLTYGLFVGTATGDLGVTESYSQLALSILERMPDPAIEALVRFLYAAMVSHWTHPVERGLEHAERGFQRGLEGGSMLYAALCRDVSCTIMLHAGRPLERVLEAIETARAFGERVRMPEAIDNVVPLHQMIRALRGETRALDSLDDDDFDTRAFLTRVASQRGGTVVAITALLRARLLIYAGRHRDAEALLDEHAADIKRNLSFSFERVELLVQRGLIAAALRRGRAAARAIRAPLRELEKLAARCPENLRNKVALLRGEQLRALGRGEEALVAYTRAIEEARARGFIHDEALARELAGRFFLGTGASEAAHPYLARARQLYLRWGAFAKVAQLDEEFPELERAQGRAPGQPLTTTLSRDVDPRRTTGSSTRTSTTAGGLNQVIDLHSVMRASEAFATEMNLERLLTKIMQIAVENAGAERGVLVLARDDGLVAELEYTARGGGQIKSLSVPLEQCDALSSAIALLAHRKREPVVLEDASADPVFSEDRWVATRGAASILCVPVLHQGSSLGVLYLENRLAPGVFTKARLETLKVLAVQAAISIQHALFYERLEAARAEAEAANRAKSRFLANMSHELRTPLNAILGYTELTVEELRQADGDFGDIIDDLGRVHRSGELLLGIIADILDLTKIEAGTLELQPIEVALDELLSEIADTVHPQLQYAGNELRCEFAGELGRLRCDPQKLRQVLYNLLSNANKFTAEGVVTLSARRRVDGDGRAWVDIVVRDTGIGMSDEEREAIFEAFHQADSSSTRQYGGAGLGLTIVRKLCERMGARVAVESARGEGSSFTVSLPALT